MFCHLGVPLSRTTACNASEEWSGNSQSRRMRRSLDAGSWTRSFRLCRFHDQLDDEKPARDAHPACLSHARALLDRGWAQHACTLTLPAYLLSGRDDDASGGAQSTITSHPRAPKPRHETNLPARPAAIVVRPTWPWVDGVLVCAGETGTVVARVCRHRVFWCGVYERMFRVAGVGVRVVGVSRFCGGFCCDCA